jgi:hypothetical protein
MNFDCTIARPALAAERSILLSLCLLVTSITLLFSQAAITDGSDGRSMYEVTKAVVERASLSIDQRYGFRGRDGQYYASHGLGLPLVALVPYAAARPVAWLTGRNERVIEAAVASLMPLITGLVAAALYVLARRLGATIESSVTVALGACFGTYLLTFSKEFFSEPLAALCLVVATERAVAKQPVASGAMTALAALTRPQYFAFVPVVAWRLWWDCGWRAAIRSIVPMTAGLLLAVAYNVARFGDATHFGYAGLGFTTPFLRGAVGLLFHPDKSIFLFAPIAVLIPAGLRRLWRINQTAFWLLTTNLVLTFVVLANWVDWYGGWVWGPRPLIAGIIPATAAIPVWIDHQRRRHVSVLCLFAIGFLVSAPTLIVSQRAQLADHPAPFGPTIVRQIALVPPTIGTTIADVRGHPAGHKYEEYVNVWQIGLIQGLGWRGAWLAAVVSAVLVGIGVWSVQTLRTTIRSMS